MPTKFTESSLCKQPDEQYCHVCRDLDNGRHWREAVIRIYPEAQSDFACPKCKPWVTATVLGRSDLFTVGQRVQARLADVQAVLKDHAVWSKVKDVLAPLEHDDAACSPCRERRVLIAVGALINGLVSDYPELLATVYGVLGLS